MALILRVDVDKPYGHANLVRKIASKFVEDYFPIPLIGTWKYLTHLEEFIAYCNAEKVPGFFYHRICTRPTEHITELLLAGGHKICFHAENTRSFDTFSKELNEFRAYVKPLHVGSFTKHGSGQYKLGKHHYAPYEPEKYLEWAEREGVKFHFGNGISKKAEDLYSKGAFFPDMFWMERNYRDPAFADLQPVLDAARHEDVAIIIHPCNFVTHKEVRDDLSFLVRGAREMGIPWKVF